MSDPSYADLIQGLGRVKVDHDSTLDVTVAAQIAGRVGKLRREQIPHLDGELGVTYPLVVVKPVCWAHELADGTGGMVKGRVSPFQVEKGVGIWAVELSAVVALEYSDALLEGVLAHEFLHYVWSSQAMADRGGGDIDLTIAMVTKAGMTIGDAIGIERRIRNAG